MAALLGAHRQIGQRSTHHKSDLDQKELLPTGLKTYDNFLELVCVGAWLNFFAKVLQMLMVWLIWPEIDDPPVYSDQTWPDHNMQNKKLASSREFGP